MSEIQSEAEKQNQLLRNAEDPKQKGTKEALGGFYKFTAVWFSLLLLLAYILPQAFKLFEFSLNLSLDLILQMVAGGLVSLTPIIYLIVLIRFF